MSRRTDLRFRATTAFQRRVNPLLRRLPFQTVLETRGRVSGLPRRTPVGGRRVGDSFWLVSEFGERSQYVRNIKADPRVRVRIRAGGTRGRRGRCRTTIRWPGCGGCPASTAWGCGRSGRIC
ncbi:hypothetical protein C1703_16695 [Streptomyces sp. Go-475]|nr:hypothetical protein C1703_16695 [Streptomyces sp. Go-475]